jgi:Kef-type K+ transport system membrane component KefB
MKSLVICVVVVLLGLYGPHRQGNADFNALWGLGALLTLALVAHRGMLRLGLPPMAGWFAAGLLAGRSGLQLVQPTDSLLYPALIYTALWLGFKTGLRYTWPATDRWWILPSAAAASTAATLAAVTLLLALIVDLPWSMALCLGAWACLWCPFTVTAATFRPAEGRFNLLGAAWGIVALSGVFAALVWHGFFASQALYFSGTLWLSLGLGAAWGGLARLSRLMRSPETTATVLCGGFALAGLVLQHIPLFALPAGLAAGLVLNSHRDLPKYLHALFEPGPPLAGMFFFALIGATIDLRILWPMPLPVWYVVMAHLAVLTLIRGLGPALQRLQRPQWLTETQLSSYSGWLVLPKAALLFELVYHPQLSMVGLFPGAWALLVKQIAVAEIMLYGVLAVIAAAFVLRRHPITADSD